MATTRRLGTTQTDGRRLAGGAQLLMTLLDIVVSLRKGGAPLDTPIPVDLGEVMAILDYVEAQETHHTRVEQLLAAFGASATVQ